MTHAGFLLWDGSSFISEGSAANQIAITEAQFAQEGPYEFYCFEPLTALLVTDGIARQPRLDFRFTKFSLPAESCYCIGGFREDLGRIRIGGHGQNKVNACKHR